MCEVCGPGLMVPPCAEVNGCAEELCPSLQAKAKAKLTYSSKGT